MNDVKRLKVMYEKINIKCEWIAKIIKGLNAFHRYTVYCDFYMSRSGIDLCSVSENVENIYLIELILLYNN